MKSMTGMGRASGLVAGNAVRIEIKSINHRYCEVSVRLPSRYLPLEFSIQQVIKKKLSRGKIDVFVSEEKSSDIAPADLAAFRSCFNYLRRVKDELDLEGDISLQDVLSGVNSWVSRDLDAQKAWGDFEPLLNQVLTELVEMREKEGRHLQGQMQKLFDRIGLIIKSISERFESLQPEIEKRVREKIQVRVKELSEIDPQRLHTEVAYYLDRMDVTEELQRLASHMSQMHDFFTDANPSGRKMDFLLQEFNREFNTIASKIQNTDISHLVVEAKADLEKIREQVQNIE